MNAKLKYQFGSDFTAGVGIANRNNKPEYSGMANYKKITLSGWYTEKTQKVGTALTLDFDRFYSVLVWKQNQTIANISVVKLFKAKEISLYADNGYSFVSNTLVRGEWGLLKDFDSPRVKGLFGLGYVYETRSIAGYFFVHL